MTQFSLALKNILRKKVRTFLTVFGISIGIATIVCFSLITSGFSQTALSYVKPGKADISIAKAGASDIVISYLDVSKIETIEQIEGVESVHPSIFGIVESDGNPFFILSGLRSDSFDAFNINLIEGVAFEEPNQVVIGKIIAKNKNLTVGDKITIQKVEYNIVGIYESGVSFQDSGAVGLISEVQRLQGLDNKVNTFAVVVTEGVDPREIADKIEIADPELLAIVDISDFTSFDQGQQGLGAVSWAISLLAVLIGGVGVMNTIITSVFERTREIGLLKAIGWNKVRIIGLILTESVFIGIFAAIAGSLMGLGIIWLISISEFGQAWIVINLSIEPFIQALIVSLVVVLFGSIYPALRAANLNPIEALRYE